MTRTVTRSYDDYATASAVVEELESAGFSNDDVSLIVRVRRRPPCAG